MTNEQVSTSSPVEDEATEQVNIDQLQQLVQMISQSDVTEIEIKRGANTRLTLRKPQTKAVQGESDGLYDSSSDNEAAEEGRESTAQQHIIIAPLVGVFNNSTRVKGGGKPVAVNDQLRVGQIVGAIQSLNIMNEVETPVAGRVVEILVQNGDTVEYGQPLIVLELPEEND